jgi:hypothetical protein
VTEPREEAAPQAHAGREPSGAPARPTVITAYVVQASFGFLLGGLGPCLILLARDLSTPREALSWVSAGFGVGLLVAGVVGERLLRIGTWRFHRLAAAVLGLGGGVLALAPGLQAARAGAMLLGLGGAGATLVSPVVLAGPGGTARMSWAFGLNSLSGIASPLLMGAVDAATGHGRAALLVAVPGLLWAALRRGVLPAPTAPAPVRVALPRGTRRKAAWWWLAVVASVSPEFAFVIWGAARLLDSGLDPAAAATAAAAFPIGMSLGRMVVVPQLLGRFPLVPWSVALAALSAGACAAPLGPAAVTVACGLAGLGIAALYPLSLGELVRLPGMGPGGGSTVGALGSGTAVLLAPILLGALARTVPLRLGFLAAVPLLLLVLALHALARRAVGRHP